MRPGALAAGTKQTLMVILSVFLLLAIVSRLLAYFKKEQPPLAKLLKKSYLFWLVNTLVGLVWLFFRIEVVPLFSARFWILLMGLVDLFWLFYILKYAIKQMPREKKAREEKKQFQKYLPK